MMHFIQPLEAWGCNVLSFFLIPPLQLLFVGLLSYLENRQQNHMSVLASVRWRSPSYCCAYWRSLVLFLPYNSGAHVCYFCSKPLNLKIEHPLLSMDGRHFTILSPIFFEWTGLILTGEWDCLWGLPCFLSLSVFCFPTFFLLSVSLITLIYEYFYITDLNIK